ncbi:glycosyltransferase [Candidatus Woesebacteria bacterium]|nr:glycosyltransferase [Candidatus Woesebacteria bacterium]
MIPISLVIPTYRRVEQTIKTIEILTESMGLGTEIQLQIIVSDASDDRLLEERLPASNKYCEIKYTRPPQTGIAYAKNHGASQASNQILIFCDTDIELEPMTLLNTLSALQHNPSVGMVGGTVIWKGSAKDKTIDRPRKEDRKFEHHGIEYIEALYSRYIGTYTKLFHDIGGYDIDVFNMRGEGSDLSIRYWRAGYPLMYDPKIAVHHIHDVEGGIIRNVPEPELDIAKDLFLLAYKYDMISRDYENFTKTVEANFKHDQFAYSKLLRGLLKHIDFIIQKKPVLDIQKQRMNPRYDFKFLEVFTNSTLLQDCIKSAPELISNYRQSIFH